MFKLIGGINTAGKTMYLEDLYLSMQHPIIL